MQDISGFGLRVTVVASNTFPQGIVLSQFADDADSLDTPAQTIADGAMGLNGDLVTWSAANPYRLTLNMIPNSDDDRNLVALLDANRVAAGKRSARDVITITVVYPDGRITTFKQGKIIDGMLTNGVAQSGRMKTHPFNFMFEGVSRT